jgi:hypothetical protein
VIRYGNGRYVIKSKELPMELPRKAVFQARLKPSILFHKVKYDIANSLASNYPNWRMSSNLIELRDLGKHISIDLSSRDVGFSFEIPEALENLRTIINSGISVYCDFLKHEKFERLGTRFYYLIPVSMNFSEIKDIMQHRLTPDDERLADILTPIYDDLAYIVDYTKENFQYHFKAGPVLKRQVPELIPFKEDNFEDSGFYKLIESISEVNLFVDIDCYQANIEIAKLDEFIGTSFNNCESTFSKFYNYLLEETK